ncbi:ribulose-phosphate 3-epimerase [Marinitoga sp. 1135]|uniref:Ribulose-phosphate 3-epimerase n=1 Tax=Marinitoga piezophila (strain DSM 14283 / JCM 11233 / KA3) TaxID=443254 RepID=H2J6V7_MARPK|nr:MULTISPECIES: ribulose-phosphate 3-epimerase [Marinitoga]AEX85222.1 ribulose-phosphate 3-epimerase [Marinitoga piezophila KA3]APT75712.1 ribulose-phosphate 3-epimerase [Marinitoga sp. 1137]NUU95451.1 ribulose-phosphate 3-epimerase [Marinitoga sp. 1135]
MEMKIYPSILAADFLKLGEEIKKVENNVDGIHIDVMDGMFVPNISFGTPIVKAVKKVTDLYLDAHLMIVDPDRYIEDYAKMGVHGITVHYEATTHLHRTVSKIKELGCDAGVSLNPHTPVFLLEEILPYLDRVLIMSVNPGFTGQKFIPSSLEKIRKLKSMIDEKNLNVTIEVDGGVGLKNIRDLYLAGVREFVVGAGVFHQEDSAKAAEELKKVGLGE